MEKYMVRFAGPRKGMRSIHFDKESTEARRLWNRMSRNRMCQAIRNARDIEEIDIFPLRKTSGWWTW